MKEVMERIALALEQIAGALKETNELSVKRSEAGKRSAEARKEKYGSSDPRTNVNKREQCSQVKGVNWLPEELPQLVEQLKSGTTSRSSSQSQGMGTAVGTYIKAWQSRYGTNARPDVGGKAQGILKRLAKDIEINRLVLMLQTYCQMENEWFVKKRHDLATLEQNVNVVALALDKGHERTDTNWTKVFGGDSDQGFLSAPNRPNEQNVGGALLPPGEDDDLLEEFPE